ncbi:very short patch repair endonuclease [Oceanobacillus oncorhynchi subsp. incaldanensis]|uniref:very short patch repair endonuclease n=1 Tax=Oceanobacillus oncorhynchi TaxID=545501 RepID=UPI001B1B5B96|nr:very short patch repair endonuclease [Oceanobacillus oncorhynchi]GIO21132.1 very short patch repair endonuclease [Oceanobacillus oncorhynchi subsp. incaldanensis]
MADIISKEQRKKNMKAIKSVSKLESIVSRKLWKNGFRFRRNSKTLFGKPDISIKKYQVVIFIDSCFWHQCPLHANMPKTNTKFWEEKFKRNKERDREVNEYYKNRGWHIKRVWEHEIKNDIDKVIQDLTRFIIKAQQKR